jgi:hypothetical protein
MKASWNGFYVQVVNSSKFKAWKSQTKMHNGFNVCRAAIKFWAPNWTRSLQLKCNDLQFTCILSVLNWFKLWSFCILISQLWGPKWGARVKAFYLYKRRANVIMKELLSKGSRRQRISNKKGHNPMHFKN